MLIENLGNIFCRSLLGTDYADVFSLRNAGNAFILDFHEVIVGYIHQFKWVGAFHVKSFEILVVANIKNDNIFPVGQPVEKINCLVGKNGHLYSSGSSEACCRSILRGQGGWSVKIRLSKNNILLTISISNEMMLSNKLMKGKVKISRFYDGEIMS